MRFLGPATELDGAWVRPHDLVIHTEPGVGGQDARVERVTHLGFEVRVDLTLRDGSSTWVQLSRGAAAELDLAPEDQVWVSRATPSKRQGALARVLS
jgi:sulfate transport system ATP-binding protein